MGLRNCLECGKEISEKAKSCPHCGWKVKWPIPKPILAVFAVVMIICLIAIFKPNGSNFSETTPQQSSVTTTSSQAPITETTEQKIENIRQGLAIKRAAEGAKILKESMRDPDSFKIESALVIDKTGAVCYEYRAKNGFGGTNIGQAALSANGKKFKSNDMDGFAKLWNKECANKTGQDVASAIKWGFL